VRLEEELADIGADEARISDNNESFGELGLKGDCLLDRRLIVLVLVPTAFEQRESIAGLVNRQVRHFSVPHDDSEQAEVALELYSFIVGRKLEIEARAKTSKCLSQEVLSFFNSSYVPVADPLSLVLVLLSGRTFDESFAYNAND